MAAESWRGLRVGDQIRNLEYTVDDDALAEYRRVVGGDACFPNLMAEDCRAMLVNHWAGASLTTVWQRLDFLRPPILGRRLQVGGWLRDIRVKCGCTWLKASAFAVDEIGTEILRSEAAFAVGQFGAQSLPIVERAEAQPQTANLAGSRAGDGGFLGKLDLPVQKQLDGYFRSANGMFHRKMPPDGNGLTSVAAGWLEGLVAASFGENFRWGGRLSIAYHRAVTPGTALLCDAVVLSHDIDAGGVETWRLRMSVRDSGDNRVMTADALIKSPSPRLI